MIIEKLASHPYSQCHVCIDGDQLIFVSYRTPVVVVDGQGYVHALPMFNCSATTRRQVGWFLREYTDICYTILRDVAREGLAIHSQYGDVIEEE